MSILDNTTLQRQVSFDDLKLGETAWLANCEETGPAQYDAWVIREPEGNTIDVFVHGISQFGCLAIDRDNEGALTLLLETGKTKLVRLIGKETA